LNRRVYGELVPLPPRALKIVKAMHQARHGDFVFSGRRPARSEVANLRVSDIDSKRMVIRVEQVKRQEGPQRQAVTTAVGAAAAVVAGWTADDVAVMLRNW
jgi:integrase